MKSFKQFISESAIDNPNFWKWFGDSKVVDEQGNPLVVYHGTNTDFDQFITYYGAHFGNKDQVDEIHDRMDFNELRDGLNTIPVYLSIQNPKRIKDLGSSKYDWRDAKQKAISQGYDGFIYKNRFEGDKRSDSYVAFYQSQIKSAIGNNGNFDPNNPIITEAVSRDILRDMKSFGLFARDIQDGYVTLYHGGKKLPTVLRKGEIFFMTPSKEEAADYAQMRKGKVFTIKVRPEDVNWNQGSYEVEFEAGGRIEDGVLVKKTSAPRAKVASVKGAVNADDPWGGSETVRQLRAYKGLAIGDVTPKAGWKVLDIIQHKGGQVQFQFTGDRWFDGDTVINYEFGK